METTSMETSTAKARSAAGRKASYIAAVIKSTECAGACTLLSVKRRGRTSVERIAMVGIGVVEVAVAKVVMVEIVVTEVVVTEVVAIDDRSAVGDVGVVVVDHGMAVPVASPVMPAPTISAEETDAEPESKSNARPSQENPRHWIPAWICDDRVAIHQPGIIGRHVDDLRIGWFDDDGVALGRYVLLFIAIQVAGLVSLLAQCLDGVRDSLLLVGICVA